MGSGARDGVLDANAAYQKGRSADTTGRGTVPMGRTKKTTGQRRNVVGANDERKWLKKELDRCWSR